MDNLADMFLKLKVSTRIFVCVNVNDCGSRVKVIF